MLTLIIKIISDNVNFRAKNIIRDKEVHLINDKGLNLFKRHRILNVFIPNNRAANYMKQKLINLQRKIDKSTIIAVDFKTLFLIIDRISR